MNIKLSHKMIKEQCGTVSFKRGDAFYRTDKVTFVDFSMSRCKATVRGVEDFRVSIETTPNGDLLTDCTCPKLASVQTDCQHIAAVLISIYEQQRKGITPNNRKMLKHSTHEHQEVTDSFLNLFHVQPTKPSGYQNHFEHRKVLEVQIIFKLVKDKYEQTLIGIGVKVGSTLINSIRSFLMNVAEGNTCRISQSLLYDPSLHCFDHETDAVLQHLIQVTRDEGATGSEGREGNDYSTIYQEQILIPPSAWETLLPALRKAPTVKIEMNEKVMDLDFTNGTLPLQFDLTQTESGHFQLKIDGLSRISVLKSYQAVLVEGKLIPINWEDIHRLTDLIQMLEDSGRSQLPITKNQLGFFMEKVVPGLKKLGVVRIPSAITSEFIETPLVAKLYLDRVNNRLLAGLEFHYEHIVFNPLDSQEVRAASILIRDEAKEAQILQLMEDSSFATTDSGYYLHNEELEYEFLYNMVPKLQKIVQIYATTSVRNRVFKGNTFPKINVKIKKERTNWLEFKFEMDGLPERDIKEILQALEEKRKYYRLRNGSLLSLETREFEEINTFLKTIPEQTEAFEGEWNVPIVRGLQLIETVEGDNAFTFEDSFRKFLETIHHPDLLDYEVPSSLIPVLRDYQVHGFKWMKTLATLGFGGILADDMGLGKTVQSIAYILSELEPIRSKKQPVLIVCPSSLSYNWINELMKFAPELQAIVVDGTQRERAELQKEIMDMDVVVISYPLLRRDLHWYEKQLFHTIFFDEAQNFKNPLTQTARAVKKLQAQHRFALTGTPVENSLEELWSVFHVVFPELFLSLKEYSHLTKDTISRRIRPFMLRRVKEDVLSELPEKTESLKSIELLPNQKKLYAAYLAKLRHDTFKHLDKETIRKNKIKILAGLTRLRQICCHPALFVDGYKGSSAKFEQLMQIVDESRHSGRRVLIFSQFTKMLELIGRELAIRGLPFYYLDGQTPAEERVSMCNQFNAGGRDFFLISLKAGGTGLNLTGADTVILYDLWWNPAVEEQAADRAHRMGQTNPVKVIKLVSKGTIEEKMNELQAKKKRMIEEIIDSEDPGSSTLTDDDIREILMI
ncbi:DEAD/DEAH box helicase [Mesobacillus persicus]|uniref:DEAD/DEAH box helicase n=1 Tax=Mesobacillus persicus TaxID=930146 RepID=UPI000B80ABCE|nr:DEAD/DEAH box helicase [Mesobacillus persicus]